MSNFCTECGAKLNNDSKFCTECGAVVKYAKPAAPAKTASEYAKPAAPAANPAAKPVPAANPDPEPNSGGVKRRVLCIALVLIMIVELGITALKYPGFLIHGDDKYNTEIASSPLQTDPSKDPSRSNLSQDPTQSDLSQAGLWQTTGDDAFNPQLDPANSKIISEETINVSEESLNADTGFGVNVALTEYVLKEDAQLTVASKENIYEENGDYIITPVSVELGEVHRFNDYVTVEIPYDDSFMDNGESAEDCVCGVYYNQQTGMWEETLYTVDTAAKKVIINTDHFSDFGAMTIKNKGLRSAYITDYRKVIDNSEELVNMAQSAEILQEYIDNKGKNTQKAAQTGLRAFIKGAGDLSDSFMNATADSTDALNNYLSFVYAYDLSDVSESFGYAEGLDFEKVVKGAQPQKWQRVVNAYARLGVGEPKNIFSNAKLGGLAEKLSNLGKVLSVYKITMGVLKSIKSSDVQTVMPLYKDCASFAMTFASDATLGMFMSVVYVADVMINTAYKEADGMRYGKIADSYEFYNRKYEGDSINGFRKSRTPTDWRETIIKTIEDNADSDADISELIKEEIKDYANHYWTIDSAELHDVLISMPQEYKNVSQERSDERKKLTDKFIKETYAELVPVMQSVQNYYSHKMEEEVQKTLKRVMDENNSYIPFAITDMYSGYESDYKGYTVKFFPLSEYADEKDWTFTMGSDGCISDKFTFIGYEIAGRPYAVAVYEPGQNFETDDPIEMHPLNVSPGSGIQIVLDGLSPEEKKKQVHAKSVELPIKDESLSTYLGIEVYDGQNIYSNSVKVKQNADLSLDITIPAESNNHFKGYYDDEYYAYNISGISFHAVPESGADDKWQDDGYYTCSADLTGQSIEINVVHNEKGRTTSKVEARHILKDGAYITYEEQNGKVYLYIYVNSDLEAHWTYCALNDNDTDQYRNSEHPNVGFSLECYNYNE